MTPDREEWRVVDGPDGEPVITHRPPDREEALRLAREIIEAFEHATEHGHAADVHKWRLAELALALASDLEAAERRVLICPFCASGYVPNPGDEHYDRCAGCRRAEAVERMFTEAQDVNRDYAGRLEDALHRAEAAEQRERELAAKYQEHAREWDESKMALLKQIVDLGRERDEAKASLQKWYDEAHAKRRDLATAREVLVEIRDAYAPSPGWLRDRTTRALRSLDGEGA